MKIGDSKFYFFVYRSRINKIGKVPIHCRMVIQDQINAIATGSIIDPKFWIKEKSTVIQAKDPISFANIERWKSIIIKHFTKAYFDNKFPELNQILLELGIQRGTSHPTGLIAVFGKYLEGIKAQVPLKYAPSTLRKLETIYTHVKSFIKETYGQKELPLSEIKLKHLVEFEEFLTLKLKLRQITINKSIQRLKSIIKYAIAHDYMDKDPWLIYRAKSVQIEIKYLTRQELQKVESLYLEDKKLIKVRDCFIFACYTGLGYAELKASTQSCLEEQKNIHWLSIRRQKTKKIQRVPVLPKAKVIWDKYNGKLPVISNQKMNEYLKVIGNLCHISTPLSTHLARKTFASTVLLANNVPLKVVSNLLAHSDSRITEKHYAELHDEIIVDEIQALLKTMSSL